MEYSDFSGKQIRATDIDEMDARVFIGLFGAEEYTGCSGVRYFKNRYTVKSESVYIDRNSGFEVAEGGEAWNIEEDYSALLNDDEITLPEESWIEALKRLENDLLNTRPFEWGGDKNEMYVGSQQVVNYEVFVVDQDNKGYFVGSLNKNFSASGEYACFRPEVGDMIDFFKSDEEHDPRNFRVVWYNPDTEEDEKVFHIAEGEPGYVKVAGNYLR